MSILQVVKGCPLFYELYDEEILNIVGSCRVLNLSPGDVIFNNGDIGNELFLILNGSAVVKRGNLELAHLHKGDLFGEMVLLKDNLRKADTVADDFCDILVVDYETIFCHYQNDSKTFALLILNLARMLATRLHKAGGIIEKLVLENAKLKDKKAA
ncbi:MAG: cyclic nucleotide-binding domain-containing protein [Bdellovibrionota bacterium]